MTVTQSVVDTVSRSLDAAESAARDYGAFVTVFRERALAEARGRDGEPRRGPLHGVPVAVKDNIDVAGAWTRCGTPGFGHRLAREDAAVVARLRAAGAVVVGKTRMHELAWGMTTPGCRNPRDPRRMVGGSSGGSAAAVAADAVPVALGTDTGGSIRNPAALCGVVGAKVPDLPMDGIAPLAPTQDTVGVLAADTGYCADALEALGVPVPRRVPARVGLLTDRWAWRVEPVVAQGLDRAATALRQVGVTVSKVELPLSGLAPSASYVTMLAEAAREWLRTGEPPEPGELGGEVRGLLETGARVDRADYERALTVGSAIREALMETLRHVDALLLPTCPVVAAPSGAESVHCAGRDIPVTTAHSALTALASVTGTPALSVPAPGTSGLPVGVQFLASDAGTLCSLAAAVERVPGGSPGGRRRMTTGSNSRRGDGDGIVTAAVHQ